MPRDQVAAIIRAAPLAAALYTPPPREAPGQPRATGERACDRTSHRKNP